MSMKEKWNIPSKKAIKQYYDRFFVPENICRHMQAVADFAFELSSKIKEAGNSVRIDAVVSAALLHDCLRICDIRNFIPEKIKADYNKNELEVWEELRKKYGEIGHEKAMAEILRYDGFEEIGDLIEKHNFFRIDELNSLEEKVLYYSDKRVEFDQVVSLNVRFEEGRKRNFAAEGDDLEKVLATENKVYKLEEDLFKLAGI